MCAVSDESVLGGLSLLLMAGQHITASSVFTAPAAAADVTKSDNLLRNSATISRLEASPPSLVSTVSSALLLLPRQSSCFSLL